MSSGALETRLDSGLSQRLCLYAAAVQQQQQARGSAGRLQASQKEEQEGSAAAAAAPHVTQWWGCGESSLIDHTTVPAGTARSLLSWSESCRGRERKRERDNRQWQRETWKNLNRGIGMSPSNIHGNTLAQEATFWLVIGVTHRGGGGLTLKVSSNLLHGLLHTTSRFSQKQRSSQLKMGQDGNCHQEQIKFKKMPLVLFCCGCTHTVFVCGCVRKKNTRQVDDTNVVKYSHKKLSVFLWDDDKTRNAPWEVVALTEYITGGLER